jgi:hypothetical protein
MAWKVGNHVQGEAEELWLFQVDEGPRGKNEERGRQIRKLTGFGQAKE